MKYLLPLVLSMMITSTVFASEGISCEMEAKVIKIHQIGVLDDTVSLSRITQENSFHYVALFEVTSALRVYGNGECKLGEVLVELKDQAQVEVGQNIKIKYTHFGDRAGMSVSYIIL